MRRRPQLLHSRRLRGALLLVVAAGMATAQPIPDAVAAPHLADGSGEGTAVLDPPSSRAGEPGTFVVRFEVGASGILPGGGILVDFPKSWLAAAAPGLMPPVKELQLADSTATHHLSASASRPDVHLDLSLSPMGDGGESERLGRLLRIVVREGTLHPGSTIEVTFAHTTAPILAERDFVRIAVDRDGSGRFRRIPKGASYEIVPGPATSVRLLAPSQSVVGRPVELRIVALDRFDNPARSVAGLLVVSGLADEPLAAEYGPNDRGILRLRFTPETEGWLWPTVEGTVFDSGSATAAPVPVRSAAGPMRVLATEPGRRILWGDPHTHSRTSADAIGEVGFAYARDVAGLDFAAATEHVSDDTGESIGFEEGWDELRAAAVEHHRQGSFVTLLGYERVAAEGGRTVLLGGLELLRPAADGRAFELRLDGGDALAVVQPSASVDGRAASRSESLRLLEIHSGLAHRRHDALADLVPAEPMSSVPARRRGAHQAWAAGVMLGVTAASDDHTGRPGRERGGLTAVVASAVTREAVLDALGQRRTYATTGERIVLDFAISGAPMGGVVDLVGVASGSFEIAAPAPLRFVEVVAYDHRDRWWTVARWEEPGRLLASGFVDTPELPTLYYLRAELVAPSGEKAGRAWSSPVWVRPVGDVP